MNKAKPVLPRRPLSLAAIKRKYGPAPGRKWFGGWWARGGLKSVLR